MGLPAQQGRRGREAGQPIGNALTGAGTPRLRPVVESRPKHRVDSDRREGRRGTTRGDTPAGTRQEMPTSRRLPSRVVDAPTRSRVRNGPGLTLQHGAARRATWAPSASYPIIRHVSFVGSAEARRSDHQLVQAFLARASPVVAGVLLDRATTPVAGRRTRFCPGTLRGGDERQPR